MQPQRVSIRHHLRPASTYVAVLAVTTIVMVIGLSALTAVRVQRRSAEADMDLAQARENARAAIDLMLLDMENDTGWRDDLAVGTLWPFVSLERGWLALEILEMGTGVCDPVRLRASGGHGDARYVTEVLVEPDMADWDPLIEVNAALNPIAWWRLGDQDGLVAGDASGSHPGTYVNGCTKGEEVPYRCDTGVYFDGNNDYVDIPHAPAFMLPKGSVSLWFKPSRLSGTQGLFGKDSYGYDTGGHLSIYLTGSQLQVRLQSASGSWYVTSWSLSSNTWCHAVFCWGEYIWLYIDGTLAAANGYSGGLDSSSGGSGNFEPIALGVSVRESGDLTSSGWAYPFQGVIDEVSIYDTLLSEDQVKVLYQAGSQTPPQTLRPVEGSWAHVVD